MDFKFEESEKRIRLRKSKSDIFKKKKVVVSANSTPGTFWRVKAAIDYEGIYVSHSLWCFVPTNSEICLEIIMAILNSKLSNLYIENTNVGLYLRLDNILNIPFPELTFEQKESITKCIKEIENDIHVEQNRNSIDYILYDAFNLDDYDINLIESYYGTFTEKKANVDDEFDVDTIQITGNINKIDLDNKIIQVTFVECDEKKLVKINNEIPGWLLVESVPFVCSIKEEDFYEEEVQIMDVKPLQYVYLDDDEISNLVINNYNDYRYDRSELKYELVKEEA
jgi:hypothetical protein